MPRPIASKLRGTVPLLLTSSTGDDRNFETPIAIEEKDPWLLFSFVIAMDTPFGKLAKSVGWPRAGMIPITLRQPGQGDWPADTSLAIALKRVYVNVACTLNFPSLRAHDLDPVEALARMIQKHRRKVTDSETWAVKNGCLTQEWQIPMGVTFRELSKALGVHTTAMLQWRPVILEVLEHGLDPEAAFTLAGAAKVVASNPEVVN